MKKVKGVTIVETKLNDKSAKRYQGKHVLLSPDEKKIIAWSDDPNLLFGFVKINKLKDFVFAVIPDPNQDFIF